MELLILCQKCILLLFFPLEAKHIAVQISEKTTRWLTCWQRLIGSCQRFGQLDNCRRPKRANRQKLQEYFLINTFSVALITHLCDFHLTKLFKSCSKTGLLTLLCLLYGNKVSVVHCVTTYV